MSKCFYNSKAWINARGRALRRDMYRCQINKRYGKNVEAFVVHHVIPLEWCQLYAPELSYSRVNLISLSEEAHNSMHDRVTQKLTAEGVDLVKRVYRHQHQAVAARFLEGFEERNREEK